MSKKLEHANLPNITPEEVVTALNTGAQIVNVSFPFIKDLFGKIKELVQSIQTDKLSTPHGKRLAIEELQQQVEILIAKDVVQKEYNKLTDQLRAQLIEKGIITE